MRWEKISLTLVTVVVLFGATGAPSAKAQAKKPNIMFILVDNVGWGNFGVYGGTVPTPRIDKLSSEGIRFNNYNVEVQCTPTRSAIHTGRMPVRSGTYTVPFPGAGKGGLAPWEYTIAKLLSDAGYATALYGKWHLGNVQGRSFLFVHRAGWLSNRENYVHQNEDTVRFLSSFTRPKKRMNSEPVSGDGQWDLDKPI